VIWVAPQIGGIIKCNSAYYECYTDVLITRYTKKIIASMTELKIIILVPDDEDD